MDCASSMETSFTTSEIHISEETEGTFIRRARREHQIIQREFNHLLTAIHWIRVSPIYWDRENCVARIIESKSWKLQYYCTILVIFTVQGLLQVGCVKEVHAHGFQLNNFEFMYHLIVLLPGVFSVLLHTHTAIHLHDLVALINGLMSFWIAFTTQYTKSEAHAAAFEKSARFLSGMLKFITISLFVASLTAIPSYLIGGCELHVFAFLVSGCARDWPFGVWVNAFLTIMMAILEFVWCLYEGASAMILFLIGCSSVVFSAAAWKLLE